MSGLLGWGRGSKEVEMTDRYILVDGVPVEEPDLLKWAMWMENDTVRRVGYTETYNAAVSTVFLGLDHSFGGGEPVLYETMIFGGEFNGYQERYHTFEEAREGHDKAVKMIIEADKK